MKPCILLSAVALTATTGLAQANTRLLVNCFWSASHFACSEVLPAWIDEVERVTEGRVRGIIPPKTVAPPPEQMAAVEKGIADVAVMFNGFLGANVQGPRVAMLPFVGTHDAEAMSRALWKTNRAYFPEEISSVHLLSQFVISPGGLYSQTNAPINSLEELSNRKMWVLPGPLATIAKSLGVGVVSGPAVNSNEIISRGVVDGHLGLDADAVNSFQLAPYTKSQTVFETAIYTTSFSVFMNLDTWAEISPEDQNAIMSVSGEVLGAAFGARWDAAQEEARAEGNGGIPVMAADPSFEADLKAASAFVTDGWVQDATAVGLDAQGALEFYQSQIAQ